ncbi:LLM class flavin-dependent oxidoreductase [Kribbella sp. DT2]|uniref:LLM class flavin-dependent oxidoreductase n=1 Tax=Kribbella sp. DT2 TaxID=3393427 RepID=UPI003CECF0EA
MTIGLAVPLGGVSETGRVRDLRAYVKLGELARGLGYGSLWFGDHLVAEPGADPAGAAWETWTILSQISTCLPDLLFGTTVLCSAYRNPALLARMTETLHYNATAKTVVGVGAGWKKDEIDALGGDPAFARGFPDWLTIYSSILRSGAVDHSGEQLGAHLAAKLAPRAPRPLVAVSAEGPRNLRLVAKYADLWVTPWLETPDEKYQAMRGTIDQYAVPSPPGTVACIVIPHGPDHKVALSPAEIARRLESWLTIGSVHHVVIYVPLLAANLNLIGEAIRSVDA